MRIVPSFSVWTVPDVVLHGGGSVVITTGTGIHTGGGVLVTPSNPEAYVTYDMSGLSIPLGVPQSIQLQAGDVTRTLMAQVIQDDTMMIGSNTVPMGADLFANIMFTPVSSNLKLKISLLPVGGPWTGGSYKVWGTTYGSDTIYESMPIVTTECNDGMYRYGHNGQFKDNEWAGVGNHIEFKQRLQDTRTGRFISLDPIGFKYPSNAPYNFAEDRCIDGRDLEGREWSPAVMAVWNYGSKIIQSTANAILLTSTSVSAPVANQFHIWIKEGVHEGGPRDAALRNWAAPYSLNGWKLQRREDLMNVENLSWSQGKEVMNATVETITQGGLFETKLLSGDGWIAKKINDIATDKVQSLINKGFEKGLDAAHNAGRTKTNSVNSTSKGGDKNDKKDDKKQGSGSSSSSSSSGGSGSSGSSNGSNGSSNSGGSEEKENGGAGAGAAGAAGSYSR